MSEISVDKQFIELYVKNDVITINIINTLDTGNGGGSGSVQDVSVVSANGFAGTVANPTSSPDITISTTVTGLLKGNGTAVSAAVAGTDYAAASHTHSISDVTNLQTSLDGKAATSHTHAISDITSLQTTLDGKAASSHTHIIGDVTGLQTALDGKAAASHTHAISEVTGLQTALDGKVAGNVAITGATKTKITYDSKGLVTAGADITATDLPTGIDAAKIGTGVVSNTEFGYLDGVTSAIQTQLNAKASTSHTHNLDDLTDVTITTPSTNQVLKYNGTAWVNDASPAGATNLDGLTDVTITAAALGEYLRYNGTAWVDATIQAGDLPTGIDAAKLADGTISNTEFQYLNNVSSNIQTQLDGKVVSNVGITGATKTKITYDTKGLVTAGADANLDDLGDVVITSPTSSQILSYNGTNWVNSTPSAGATGDMNSAFSSGTGGTAIGTGETSIGTVSITPQSSSSKIEIIARLVCTKDTGTTRRTVTVRVKRGATQVGQDCGIYSQNVGSTLFGPAVVSVIDTHGQTGAITYTLFALCDSASGATSERWSISAVELVGPKGDPGSTTLDGLTDVVITAAASGEYIRYNGTSWVDATIQAGDLPTAIDAAKIANGNVSNTEFQYLDGVTSAIQTQIDGKASTSHTHTINDLSDVTITAAASGEYIRYSGTEWVDSSIQAADLPTGIDAAKIASGTVSNTEFGYLDGVTSAIQTQIDGKAATSHTHAISDVTGLQTALDGKVTGNATITGATKTKITYDAKGLVTAGADAVLDDLGDVVITTPSTNQVLTYNGTNWVNAAAAGGVSDGDKGDITVSNGGTTWTIDAGAVTYADIQNVAANSFLANVTGSAATVQAVATNRIPLFSSAITGTPSASTYLRGDGSWATVSGTGISNLNTLTDSTQSFAVGTSGTNFNISSATGVHTFNLPDASATARGLITTGAQTIAGAKTFSSAPTFSTMTAGSVLFAGVSGVLSQNNSQFFWDNTNNRLGIGTASPVTSVDVPGTIRLSQKTAAVAGTNQNSGILQLQNTYWNGSASTDNIWSFQHIHNTGTNSGGNLTIAPTANSVDGNNYGIQFTSNYAKNITLGGTITTSFVVSSNDSSSTALQAIFGLIPSSTASNRGAVLSVVEQGIGWRKLCLNHSGGNVIVGGTTDSGFKLDVVGTTRVQGQLTVSTGGAAITGNSTITGTLNVTSTFTLSDAQNIVVGSTTGTKIATSTSQKIGFWNVTPIVQPTTATAAAAFIANTGTAVNDASTFDGYTIAQIVKALRSTGLLA